VDAPALRGLTRRALLTALAAAPLGVTRRVAAQSSLEDQAPSRKNGEGAEGGGPGDVPQVVTVGFLVGVSGSAPYVEECRRELRRLGWSEGRNLVVEYSEPHVEALPRERRLEALTGAAAELIRHNVDVLVTDAPGALAARRATTSVPIVFTAVSDPIGLGFVTRLSRPGGNMTGLTYLAVELAPRRLQLLKEAVPAAARVGVLSWPAHPLAKRIVAEVQTAASSLKLGLHLREAREARDLESAFESIAASRVQALLVLQSSLFLQERQRVVDLAVRYQLPAIFEAAAFVEAGGLMSYAHNIPDLYRRAAGYVDRVLRGARPADMPVEQPRAFELVINAKTAQALGLALPPALLTRADRVIQ